MGTHPTAAPPAAPASQAPLDRFRDDVLDGLSRPQKELPCKYFYDARGSELFDRICELPEYYLTRTELTILRQHAHAMADALGPRCRVVEPGSGSGLKTPLLLEQLREPAGYVPVDISRDHLLASAEALRQRFPGLDVRPVWADFTGPFTLPRPRLKERRRAVFFPGSTVGNFGPAEAVRLLARMAEICGPGGAALVGVDLRKPKELVEPAYNDAVGVTAEFNRNLLVRINRELGADFDVERFRHRAFFDEQHGRIEMHLVSRRRQEVHVGGATFRFARGESIRTEYSYKYSPEAFRTLAGEAGLRVRQVWTDEGGLFSVQYLEVAG
jgi:dimethylhistidine N-methyltransferase